MTRLRLVVLLAGALTVAGSVPVLAAGPQGPPPGTRVGGGERAAHALLARAAHAATSRSWSGTQYVGTWRGSAQTSAVLDVVHQPGRGSTVTTAGARRPGEPGVVTPDLDERLLSLLADHYELVVAGSGRCTGRAASVVEARRPGVQGDGAVAGRFWLDRSSGLVLRREVYDGAGVRLRSSAFVELAVGAAAPTPSAPVLARRLDDPVAALPAQPWMPPRSLPSGQQLFDAQVRGAGRASVLHLAYSDGLTTLSVFAQRGTLSDAPGRGFRRERVRGTRVFVQPTAPERVVWQGGGQVFTLVSDADAATVRAAVAALPRDPAPRTGVLARLGRGLARLGSWLNPLD